MYTGSVEGKRTRHKSQTEEAGRVEIPYDSTPTELLMDGITSGGAKDTENRSRHKPGQCQQEIGNTRRSEAESNRSHNTDDNNNFAQNLELGDFVSASDASKEVFNNMSHSQNSDSEDMIVGHLEDNNFMDDEYIARLLDLDGYGSISGARKCSFVCYEAPTEID